MRLVFGFNLRGLMCWLVVAAYDTRSKLIADFGHPQQLTRSLAALCFILAGANSAISSAHACYAFAMEQSTFFEEQDLVAGVDAPAIAEVTILQIYATGNNRAVALARVDRAIKGPIEGAVIAVVGVQSSSCNRGFRIGASGIIVGGYRRNADGMFEISAISEFMEERLERRALRSGRQQ
jgi:hypothetical protein